MTVPSMHERLADLVDDVEGPPLASTAWERATARQRRRRVATTAAVSALVVAAVGVVALPGQRPPRPDPAPPVASSTSTPTPSIAVPSVATSVQLAPSGRQVGELPPLTTPLSALWDPPREAPALASQPVDRVVGAVQDGDGPVLVLGSDGRWKQVTTPGPDGSAAASGRLSGIRSGGTALALLRADAVVVVDVTSGQSRRLAVDTAHTGAPERVAWVSEASVVVGGDLGWLTISTIDGATGDAGDGALSTARGATGDRTVVIGSTDVTVRDGEAGSELRPLFTSEGTSTQRWLGNSWYGDGWLNGDQLAHSAFLDGGAEQAAVLMDVGSGQVTHALWFPYEGQRANGCCATIGWLDGETIVLNDNPYVLAWRPRTGELFRVADVSRSPSLFVALAP